jgi:DNA-binding MarR family transcriptional regulator
MTTTTRASEQRDHIDAFLESLPETLPDIDLAVEGIVDRIMGLSRRIKRMMEETLVDHELTWGEWKSLGYLLRKCGPEHRCSPGELSEHAELSSGAMTSRLDRLEEAGLVRRLRDPDDRRGIQVELTPAGRKAYEQATNTQAAKEAFVASALNEREKKELNALLRRMMIAFETMEAEQR